MAGMRKRDCMCLMEKMIVHNSRKFASGFERMRTQRYIEFNGVQCVLIKILVHCVRKSVSESESVSKSESVSESVSVPGSESVSAKFWGIGPHPPARTGHRFQRPKYAINRAQQTNLAQNVY